MANDFFTETFTLFVYTSLLAMSLHVLNFKFYALNTRGGSLLCARSVFQATCTLIRFRMPPFLNQRKRIQIFASTASVFERPH